MEAFNTNKVLISSIWDSTRADSSNALLITSILSPIFTLFTGLNTIRVFKEIFPSVFSLIPVGLYLIYIKIVNKKRAFLASFVFMMMPPFFSGLPGLMRQGTGEYFIMLIILISQSPKMKPMTQRLLLLILTASLVWSHYASSYIFLLMFLLSYALIIINKFTNFNINNNGEKNILRLNYILFFIVFALTWYLSLANAFNFVSLISLVKHIIQNLDKFLNPAESQSLYFLTAPLSNWQLKLTRMLNLGIQFFILLGVINELFRKKMTGFSEYTLFSISCIIIWFISLIVPGFSYTGSMDALRVYGYTLFFLSPFCITGGIWLLEIIGNIVNAILPINFSLHQGSLKILTVIFILTFLVNTGVIGFITDTDEPLMTYPLLLSTYDDSSLIVKARISGTYLMSQDVFGLRWITHFRYQKLGEEGGCDVYADWNAVYQNFGIMPNVNVNIGPITPDTPVWRDGLVFLRTFNVVEKQMVMYSGYPPTSHLYNTSDLLVVIFGNKIYSNGGSEIYYFNAIHSLTKYPQIAEKWR